MTPELLEAGAKKRAEYEARRAASSGGSGGRDAAFGRILKLGQPDFTHGVALYLDEHDMKFVEQLTQGRKKVTVLHEGSVLADGLLAEVQANEKVVEVYLGR